MEGAQRGTPLPGGRWSGITVPTLVLGGGKSPGWLRNAVVPLAEPARTGAMRHLVAASV